VRAASSSDLARFQVGSTIAGRYRIERPLDEGGKAMLVAARHINLKETVTIRFPLPELRRDPAVVARFTLEAKALARIKSDHVPRVLDVGVSMAVGPYMAMEYLEGTDLQSVLRSDGALNAARAPGGPGRRREATAGRGACEGWVVQSSFRAARTHQARIPRSLSVSSSKDGGMVIGPGRSWSLASAGGAMAAKSRGMWGFR
jgi:hypothetical protein